MVEHMLDACWCHKGKRTGMCIHIEGTLTPVQRFDHFWAQPQIYNVEDKRQGDRQVTVQPDGETASCDCRPYQVKGTCWHLLKARDAWKAEKGWDWHLLVCSSPVRLAQMSEAGEERLNELRSIGAAH